MPIALAVCRDSSDLITDQGSPALVPSLSIVTDPSWSGVIASAGLSDVAEFPEHILRTSIQPPPLLIAACGTDWAIQS